MDLIDMLNTDQRDALDLLVKGENVFLTGEAGTGKSFVIKAFSDWCNKEHKSLIKLAPTGIAAVNIGGSTLHKQFHLGFGILTTKEFASCPKLFTKADVVLIDEISMCRLDIFDCVMSKLLYLNTYVREKPIQIVLVGDFFQLPPVMTNDDKIILSKLYDKDVKSAFCFQSKYWNKLNFITHALKIVVRQSDVDFCKALNHARVGDARCLPFIMSHCKKKFDNNAVCLAGKNVTVDKLNETMLNNINSKLYEHSATVDGDISFKDCPCDEKFKFKIGARVMYLMNDEEVFNGCIGTIVGYNEALDLIMVDFDDIGEVAVGIKQFTLYKYELNSKKEIEKRELGSIFQYPLRLSYAITIHKSQGQTFEKVNFIPEIFADGQFYVAMSRCKNISEVYIHGLIEPYKVRASNEVKKFYNDPINYKFF